MRVAAAFVLAALFVFGAVIPATRGPQPMQLASKCTGADPCPACKSCEKCAYCKNGKTCGTCKPRKGERALAYFTGPTCR